MNTLPLHTCPYRININDQTREDPAIRTTHGRTPWKNLTLTTYQIHDSVTTTPIAAVKQEDVPAQVTTIHEGDYVYVAHERRDDGDPPHWLGLVLEIRTVKDRQSRNAPDTTFLHVLWIFEKTETKALRDFDAPPAEEWPEGVEWMIAGWHGVISGAMIHDRFDWEDEMPSETHFLMQSDDRFKMITGQQAQGSWISRVVRQVRGTAGSTSQV